MINNHFTYFPSVPLHVRRVQKQGQNLVSSWRRLVCSSLFRTPCAPPQSLLLKKKPATKMYFAQVTQWNYDLKQRSCHNLMIIEVLQNLRNLNPTGQTDSQLDASWKPGSSYLWLHLAEPCMHLCLLVMTCTHFGWDQICAQINVRFFYRLATVPTSTQVEWRPFVLIATY